MRIGLLGAAILLTAAPPAGGQGTAIDEGTLLLVQSGTVLGRELFSIRTSPSAGENAVQATATLSLEGMRASSTLLAEAGGAAVSYQFDAGSDSAGSEGLRGSVARGRFVATSRTPRGEARREFLVSRGSVLLDPNLYHLFFFAVRRLTGSDSVGIILPRIGREATAVVTRRAEEDVEVGGSRVRARLVVFTISGQDGERRVWTDLSGRLLRVEDTSSQVIASRTTIPR